MPSARQAAPPAQAQANDTDALKKRIEQLYGEKKYEEGLTLERQQAAETERSETASAGKPGTQTAGALGSLAWHAVLGHKFDEALAAADRAQALAPDQLWIKANRAHALLFGGRADEARAIYLAYKGKPISSNSQDSWDDLVADDFEVMRKAGLTHPMFAQMEKAFGVNGAVSRQEIKELNEQIRQLNSAGKYRRRSPSLRNTSISRARATARRASIMPTQSPGLRASTGPWASIPTPSRCSSAH